MLQVGHAASDGHNNGLSRDDAGDQILILLKAPCRHGLAQRRAYRILRKCQHRIPSDPIELLIKTTGITEFPSDLLLFLKPMEKMFRVALIAGLIGHVRAWESGYDHVQAPAGGFHARPLRLLAKNSESQARVAL